MKSHFEVTFPLILEHGDTFKMTFSLKEGEERLDFRKGLYFFYGDNGAGKTTFFNLLGLTAGRIGKKKDPATGGIRFCGEAYNQKRFNHVKAAKLRERSFSIFPQKAFFLPVSSRDNYIILNGSDRKRVKSFSSTEYPDLLSGGQQQKVLMDIVLDVHKPVWFLDEPMTNLDAERRLYFWKLLRKAYHHRLEIIFFIDHWLCMKIMNDEHFNHLNTLVAVAENRHNGETISVARREIDIYVNTSPERFLKDQIVASHREKQTERMS